MDEWSDDGRSTHIFVATLIGKTIARETAVGHSSGQINIGVKSQGGYIYVLAAAGFPVYAERSLIGLGFLEASSALGRTAADGWRVFKDLSIKFRFACLTKSSYVIDSYGSRVWKHFG